MLLTLANTLMGSGGRTNVKRDKSQEESRTQKHPGHLLRRKISFYTRPGKGHAPVGSPQAPRALSGAPVPGRACGSTTMEGAGKGQA